MAKSAEFIVIPAAVRFDKNVSANAKLLYGEIEALCGERGHCYATNGYLAELYGMTARNVQKCLSDLKERKHIETDVYENKHEKGKSKRAIRITNPRKKRRKTHEKKDTQNKTNGIMGNGLKGKGKIKQGYTEEYVNSVIEHDIINLPLANAVFVDEGGKVYEWEESNAGTLHSSMMKRLHEEFLEEFGNKLVPNEYGHDEAAE